MYNNAIGPFVSKDSDFLSSIKAYMLFVLTSCCNLFF